MKREKLRYGIKAVVFLCVGAFLLIQLNSIFLEKSSYPKYRNFQAQENIDVLILGNSHADNGIDPQILEQRYEEARGKTISVFNYSIYGMRVEQMSFFLEEALKTHVPKVILLETFAFLPLEDEHREILARRAFDMLPLNGSKVEAVSYCVPEEDKWSYYFPFLKYHTRWKELTAEDIRMVYRENAWKTQGKTAAYVDKVMEQTDDYFETDLSGLTETRAITETERESFQKILDLADAHGIQLLLVSIPFKEQLGLDSREMVKINNYLKEQYENGGSIQLLDLNRSWKELSFGYEDLYEAGHCNRNGAEKVSGALGDYLALHCKLKD